MGLVPNRILRVRANTQKPARTAPARASGHHEAGQALVEYTLILALIAIVALAALTQLGTGIADTLSQLAGDL
jgi:Flp pilus assembly pilin Flp